MPVGLKGPTNVAYPEYAPGVLLGEISASLGTYAPYNPGAGDGTQIPKAICRLLTPVDSSNNITWPGDFQNVNGTAVSPQKYVDVYRPSGTWKLDQILGLDANALAILQGAIVEGAIGVNEQDTVVLSAATNTFDLAITGADGVLHTFLAIAGNVTAANLQILLRAVLGQGVSVTLSTLTYTFTFSGNLGNQAITLASTPHTITSTDTRVATGAAATVASGQHGIVTFA
jgi:hypothetical protein